MKLVLGGREGEAHFDLVKNLNLPDLEVVVELDPDRVLAEVADADIFYGIPTAEVVKAGKKLRWIQSSSAGVEYTALGVDPGGNPGDGEAPGQRGRVDGDLPA